MHESRLSAVQRLLSRRLEDLKRIVAAVPSTVEMRARGQDRVHQLQHFEAVLYDIAEVAYLGASVLGEHRAMAEEVIAMAAALAASRGDGTSGGGA